MKKISKKKNLLTKTGLGVVAASLVMTPIVTAIACGETTPDKPIDPEPPRVINNSFSGTFSSPEKQLEFESITTEVQKDTFKNEKGLVSITLPEVTKIDVNAFSMDNEGESQLVEINLPKVETIGDHAFYNSNISAIDLPNLTKLGEDTFDQGKLKSISLAKMITLEDKAFWDVVNLDKLFLPKVVEIKDLGFDSLESANNVDLTSLTKIGSDSFSELTDMIPMPKLKEIGSGAFMSLTETEIDLPLVEKIGVNAFSDVQLSIVKIPNATIENVGDGAFDSIEPDAEIYVSNPLSWQADAAKLERIFGNNYQTIVWK